MEMNGPDPGTMTPFEVCEYARAVRGGPWPEGEAIIATESFCSLNYARLIKDRFPAGETIIATDPWMSLAYVDFIGDLFIEGEIEMSPIEYADFRQTLRRLHGPRA